MSRRAGEIPERRVDVAGLGARDLSTLFEGLACTLHFSNNVSEENDQ
jgi:hypothetical protein